MKYLILVGDGMGDFPLAELGGRTPLEVAATPTIDEMLARLAQGVGQLLVLGDRLSELAGPAERATLVALGADGMTGPGVRALG